jgi:hypothetical protein
MKLYDPAFEVSMYAPLATVPDDVRTPDRLSVALQLA